jgi:hypothetical protein
LRFAENDAHTEAVPLRRLPSRRAIVGDALRSKKEMTMQPFVSCPDCSDSELPPVNRRQFVKTVGATAAAVSTAAVVSTGALPGIAHAKNADAKPASENLTKKLHASLSPAQREKICFPWDYTDKRGLLRMHVSNNWQITPQKVSSEFFTKDQQELIEALYFGLYNPDWKDRIRKQLADDAGGYGVAQSIAMFGSPEAGPFEFVMTGRHLTIRCDGNASEHVAFGGPIFYGHAAQGFNEKADHPGNVYWHQGLKANALFQMLDGKQRKKALIAEAPKESKVQFRGRDRIAGLPASELSADQRSHLRGVLDALIEPYRTSDRDGILRCLKAQGGLDACRIAFYQSGDIGNDQVWDIWRLEGPSFVWHFRGSPHVHVWVNVADNPSVKITTAG